MPERLTLGRPEIEEILPHRDVSLFLDKVEVDGEHTTGYMRVRVDQSPGFPILPGALQIEMVAQTLGIASRSLLPEHHIGLFGGVGNCEFINRTILPGDIVRAEVEITRKRTNSIKGSGRVFKENQLIGEVNDIIVLIVKTPTSPSPQ
ncbi:hypothetical protein CMO96_02855 [Candidatus Woesebacteria bacterium]|nr:hypothetical protein [Candidatus Woesebacteria bacterium]|tara:strand:- start:661 stop:1104 length:444 start_codon:yes stop_codon:yes gene_type:complete